jgi:hypothetical protein
MSNVTKSDKVLLGTGRPTDALHLGHPVDIIGDPFGSIVVMTIVPAKG